MSEKTARRIMVGLVAVAMLVASTACDSNSGPEVEGPPVGECIAQSSRGYCTLYAVDTERDGRCVYMYTGSGSGGLQCSGGE